MSIYHNNSSSNNKLIASNLHKTFGNTCVINDVSLTLGESEIVSLLGLSGCGKSTIFNMISGLIPINSGQVIIDGIDHTNKTGRVGYMQQKDLLMPWEKIIDNVCLPLIIKGMKKTDARCCVQKYFKDFGLDGVQYKYPHQLSGGMRQRAALLRTYIFSSDIMLLDEPFGSLDAITRQKMHGWLMQVLDKINTSIIFITHDIEEAILLSDRIYVLSNKPATVAEEITVDEKRPRDIEFITSPRFNNLKRQIVERLKVT